MFTLTTSLERIRACSPCREGWRRLTESDPGEGEFNILHVLESNGVQDMLWCLRATVEDSKSVSVTLAIEFAADVLQIFEAAYPKDNRPRLAIEAAREYLRNPSQDAADAAARQIEIVRKVLQ